MPHVLGAGAGAAIGVVAGPDSAIAGAAAGLVIARAVRSAFSALVNQFSDRQGERARDAFEVAMAGIEKRLKQGEEPRDGLFTPRPGGWSDAAGLLERTLRGAAEDAQERKVKLLGKLWENIVFDAAVSTDEGHYLLGVAERLTYRQCVMLELFGSNALGQERAAELDAKYGEGELGRSILAVAEMDELGALGLLGVGQNDGTVVHPQATVGQGTFRTIALANARPMPPGDALRRLLGLADLDRLELDNVTRELRQRVRG